MLSLSLGAFVGALLAFGIVVMLAHAANSGVGGEGVAFRQQGQLLSARIAGSQLFNALTAFIITKSARTPSRRGALCFG